MPPAGYPPGAGPYGANPTGDVYVPPAVAAADSAAGGIRRPSIAQTAATVVTGRTVAVFQAPTTEAWLVRRIVVQSDTAGVALVYVGTLDAGNCVSGTASATFDENDANQPYLVPEGQAMTVHFVSGGVCSARIEYDVI